MPERKPCQPTIEIIEPFSLKHPLSVDINENVPVMA